MANEKNMNWVNWLMCLLALTAVVLAALILAKVNKKCGKQTYVHRTRNVKMNDPTEIAKLAQYHCGSNDPTLIRNFQAVMAMENACQGSLWNDGDPPGNTDDDNVMMSLCNALGSEYTEKYNTQLNSIKCALNPPNGDASQCCN